MMTNRGITYDVAIVGASLGGSAAAIELGRAGASVLLIDKAEFPRRKPCGEGMSRMGIHALEQLGLRSGSNLLVPHVAFDGFQIRSQRGCSTLKSPDDGIALQRQILDAELFSSAQNYKSVRTITCGEVRQIDPSGTISVDSDIIRARHVILSAGATSKLLRTLPLSPRSNGTRRNAATATFVGVSDRPITSVTILVEDRYEMYCTPLPENRLNICVITPSRSNLNVRELIVSKYVQEKIARVLGFRGQMELPPMGRALVGNIRRLDVLDSLLLVGDACEQFDPIGGMGMSHALKSGQLAASAIMKIEGNELSKRAGHEYYARERELVARPMRRFTLATTYFIAAVRQAPRLSHFLSAYVGNAAVRALHAGV